ncbi:MAG: hypothetical protein JOZ57_17760 [Abitibacteriaceae bacterium]|nr:hypothetical protein [Abditibacteriaceae bacterium]
MVAALTPLRTAAAEGHSKKDSRRSGHAEGLMTGQARPSAATGLTRSPQAADADLSAAPYMSDQSAGFRRRWAAA